MTRLIVSREAETDLDEVLDYLEQEAGADGLELRRAVPEID